MEMVKNMVYTGVGLASMTSEKVKETIDDQQKREEYQTQKENIVGNFFKTIDTVKEDIESQIEKN